VDLGQPPRDVHHLRALEAFGLDPRDRVEIDGLARLGDTQDPAEDDGHRYRRRHQPLRLHHHVLLTFIDLQDSESITQ
jgi:hypothetical protein